MLRSVRSAPALGGCSRGSVAAVGGRSNSGAAKPHAVTFVLHGALSHFSAANGSTPGSITLVVSASNHHGAALKGQTLTFALSASSKVVFDSDKKITDGERGLVQVRAPKNTNATTLQTLTPRMVIDQGAASAS